MINLSGWTQQQKILAVVGVLVLFAALVYAGYLTVPDLIARLLILLIAFPAHELAHAVTADRLGDPTPRRYGRITLNPLAHLDPLGSILMIFAGIGWATTPVNPNNLRGNRELSSIMVSIAGPLANLGLAVVAALLIRSSLLNNAFLLQVVYFFVLINLLLFVFNLLPIPPLDGFNILFNLLPPGMREPLRMVAQYGALLLLVLIILPGDLFYGIIGPPISALQRLLLGV